MSEFLRAVALDDIRIRSGGDGRTVEAYAAIFDVPAEVRDQDGHYYEVNHRAAWDKTIAERGGRFPVVYHHGMTAVGTPSERGAVPIGVALETRADQRGVLTVSRYHRSELADEVLEAIRSGAISGQSYGGRFIRSDPGRPPRGGFRAAADGMLRTVNRLEVAMREFGPTPWPAFEGASILEVRTLAPAATAVPTPDDKESDEQDEQDDTPVEGAVEEGPRATRAIPLGTRIRAARITRGMERAR